MAPSQREGAWWRVVVAGRTHKSTVAIYIPISTVPLPHRYRCNPGYCFVRFDAMPLQLWKLHDYSNWQNDFGIQSSKRLAWRWARFQGASNIPSS